MQCQQPPFGIGFPYPGQYIPSNPVNPFNGLAPDVIGEGEVKSITFPDGTIQYYFLPIRWPTDIYLKRWPPHPFDEMYCNSYSKPNTGVWIIRNFSNTVSPVYNQYWQRTSLDPFSKPCFGFDGSVIPGGFQLKFHNDGWTSTTDLHCFCPYVPPVAYTCSTAVQVETPKDTNNCCQIADHDNSCTKAHCRHTKEFNNGRSKCDCRNFGKNTASHMSIDKPKRSLSRSKTSPSTSKESVKISKSKQKKSSSRKETKYSDIICKCASQSSAETQFYNVKKKSQKSNRPTGKGSKLDVNEDEDKSEKAKTYDMGCKVCDLLRVTDKLVATYNDQASDVKEVEGATQTGCGPSCSWSSTDLRGHTSRFKKKRLLCRNKKRAARSTEQLIGVYDAPSSESYSSKCETS